MLSHHGGRLCPFFVIFLVLDMDMIMDHRNGES